MMRRSGIKMGLKLFLVFIAAGMTCVVVSTPVQSGVPEWPEKDIIIIVAFAPGGGYDLVARTTAPIIAKYLPKRVSVIVKNVPGAGGKIGFRELLLSKPDGHTIGLLDPMEMAVLRKYKQLENLDIDNISWLGIMDRIPQLLTVGSKSEFKTPGAMKGKPVRFGTAGTITQFQSVWMGRRLGAKVQLVNYDAAPDAFMSAMRGDVDAVLINWATALRQIRASDGKLIHLFVDAEQRIPELDIPTGAELGIKPEEGLLLGITHSFGAPMVSPELTKKWGETLSKVYQDPDWLAQMKKIGYPPTPMSGEKVNTIIREEIRLMEQRTKDIAF